MRKIKKFDPEQIALDLLNRYTRPTQHSEGWDFPIGLIDDIENALKNAYKSGIKKGATHETP